MLGAKGIYNLIRTSLGMEQHLLMGAPNSFQALLVGTDVWKEFGYNAVIYLAALTGISPSLYEAAAIDGAGRWKQTLHVTIPGLIPTVVLLSTLAMGNVLNAGFDQVFNMYNQLVISTADIIDTYVYRIGITNMQFSLGTAAGLFKSVVSLILVVVSYSLAYKFADYSIF
jgi:putative aldouronate transport system permease protein